MMNTPVAIAAQSNQILLAVTAGSASRNHVMDVELFPTTAVLASPAIALENPPTQLIVGALVLPQASDCRAVYQAGPQETASVGQASETENTVATR
jgi:hypothetical protein